MWMVRVIKTFWYQKTSTKCMYITKINEFEAATSYTSLPGANTNWFHKEFLIVI